jgi:glutamate-1-semialdehyde aminotransferase
MLERALQVIPLGAQTFSKSITHFPQGVSPHFASRAKGSRLWDVDDNEYLDFVNSLAAVLIGYGDEEVNAAVQEQLQHGVTFSLSHELEIEVAERLTQLIPCAEQVRFGKNGSDATSAAVRLARASTGRDRLAVCGYHGWQDWYIGTTSRDMGVPDAVSSLSHSFPYNDLDALRQLLESHEREFAAVIMEPMNSTFPEPGYLEAVRDLVHSHGALLVFDETITGFRFHLGGAQSLFGVTPDLATFGKGMGNGFPVSAIVGREDVMRLMEEIFFSGTFGGETLSLAATTAVLTKLERDDIPGRLKRRGERLLQGVDTLINEQSLGDVFSLSGHPSWPFLHIASTEKTPDMETRTLLLQELFSHGILSLGTHNLSAAHSDADIDTIVSVYAELLPKLCSYATDGSVRDHLNSDPLKPLFKVR